MYLQSKPFTPVFAADRKAMVEKKHLGGMVWLYLLHQLTHISHLLFKVFTSQDITMCFHYYKRLLDFLSEQQVNIPYYLSHYIGFHICLKT